MSPRTALLLIALGALAAGCAPKPAEPQAQSIDAIPTPKEVHFESWDFELGPRTILLVTQQAKEATRRAAVAAQQGLRDRLGLDLPIVRISESRKLGLRKSIWIVEPWMVRSPAKTIGVPGLEVGEEMFHDSYFIRVDALETVVHGTDEAGSWYGVQTLFELLRPPVAGTLFRKGRGPTIPCLWIRDFPARRVRPAPPGLAVPADPKAAEELMATLAHYRLNALPEAALPADPGAAAQARDLAERYYIRIVKEAPAPPEGPLAEVARLWVGQGLAARYAIAAWGELMWGTPNPPDPAAFRLRFARETFGDERAAEAIALTEPLLAGPPPPSPERERLAERIRTLWGQVKGEPALRDAFLAVAR